MQSGNVPIGTIRNAEARDRAIALQKRLPLGERSHGDRPTGGAVRRPPGAINRGQAAIRVVVGAVEEGERVAGPQFGDRKGKGFPGHGSRSASGRIIAGGGKIVCCPMRLCAQATTDRDRNDNYDASEDHIKTQIAFAFSSHLLHTL